MEMSDHYIKFINVNLCRSSVNEEVITTRCYLDLDVQSFICELEEKFRDFPHEGDVTVKLISKSRSLKWCSIQVAPS